MSWIGFVIFLVATIAYIWNGKDSFTKKEWVVFFVKYLMLLIGTVLVVVIVSGILKVWPFITVSTAKHATSTLAVSFTTILACKFAVVMIVTIFERIMTFHKKYNTENNCNFLISLVTKHGSGFLLFSKVIVSLGSLPILYGIWFGRTV